MSDLHELTTAESGLQEQIQQQAQMEAVFANPPVLPIRWNAVSGQLPDGQPVVVLIMETPAGTSKYVMPRDSAIELASMVRKQAQTGPQLVAAPPGLVVPRV